MHPIHIPDRTESARFERKECIAPVRSVTIQLLCLRRLLRMDRTRCLSGPRLSRANSMQVHRSTSITS
eukprot:2070826-Prymnesium_polylepis.1